MADGKLFRPSERGRRSPTSNAKDNGQVVNPPRYAEMGGFSGSSKGITKNRMGIRKPGDTR